MVPDKLAGMVQLIIADLGTPVPGATSGGGFIGKTMRA
jgi:hypothetical protein